MKIHVRTHLYIKKIAITTIALAFATGLNLSAQNTSGGIKSGLNLSTLTIEPVTLGLNYDMGLRQVAKDGEFTDNLLDDAKNSTIQIYLGFTF